MNEKDVAKEVVTRINNMLEIVLRRLHEETGIQWKVDVDVKVSPK